MTNQPATPEAKSLWKSFNALWDIVGLAAIVASCFCVIWELSGNPRSQIELATAGVFGIGASIGWLLHNILGVLRNILEELRKR